MTQNFNNIYYRYGLTQEDYNKLLASQNDCCAICNRHKSEFKRSLHVDHCHSSGVIRGLLCVNCNHFLGLVEHDPKRLEAWKDYLNKKLDLQGHSSQSNLNNY